MDIENLIKKSLKDKRTEFQERERKARKCMEENERRYDHLKPGKGVIVTSKKGESYMVYRSELTGELEVLGDGEKFEMQYSGGDS